MEEKYTLQCLAFHKDRFSTPKSVKEWILRNGYFLPNKRNAVKSFDNYFRVRQKEPKLFKPFNLHHKIKFIGKRKVKAIYGVLK